MNPKVNLKALLSMDLPKIDPLSFLKRTLDPRRIYQNPKRLLNPMSIRGGLLYSGAADRLVGEEAGNAVRNAVAVNSLRQMLGLQALSALKYAAPAAALLLADQRPSTANDVFVDADGNLTDLGKQRQAEYASNQLIQQMLDQQNLEPVVTENPANTYADVAKDSRVDGPDSSETAIQPSRDLGPRDDQEVDITVTVTREPVQIGSNYAEYDRDELNAFYDELRRTRPEMARDVGMDIFKALYPNF